MRSHRDQLAKWRETRELGRSHYVQRFWVVGWGQATAVLWACLMAYIEGWHRLPLFLALGLIGFPLGGYLVGRYMWALAERNYRRAVQHD